MTDIDYRHVNKVFKKFQLKYLGGYHDFYVQSDTLLVVDVTEHFRNTCIEIYEVDPALILSAQVLAWQPTLKKQE